MCDGGYYQRATVAIRRDQKKKTEKGKNENHHREEWYFIE